MTIGRLAIDKLRGNIRHAEDIDKAIATIVALADVVTESMTAYDAEAARSLNDLPRLGGVRFKKAKTFRYALVQSLAARLGVNVSDIELCDLHRNTGLAKFDESIAAVIRKDLHAVDGHVGMHLATFAEQPDREPPRAA